MNTRETLEAALAKARTDRDQASAERAKAGTDWRKQDDPTVTYDKVRANWTQADSAWNKANAEVGKLTAALADYMRAEEHARNRATLEAAVARTRAERERADAALAAAARARAERDKVAAVTAARAERRAGNNDRRKPASDRRKRNDDRRNQGSQPGNTSTAINEWTEAVNSYNKADAEWNKAVMALVEFNRASGKR
jgi:hypothetical protein